MPSSSSFSTSFMSIDIIIILGIFGVLVAVAFALGRAKTVAMYLSLYIGLLLFAYFPYTNQIASYGSTATQKSFMLIGVLMALSGLAYMAVKHSVDSFDMGESGGIAPFALAGLGTGVTLAVLHNSVPFGAIHKFPASVSAFFTFEHAFFWWLLGGLAVLFVLLRR